MSDAPKDSSLSNVASDVLEATLDELYATPPKAESTPAALAESKDDSKEEPKTDESKSAEAEAAAKLLHKDPKKTNTIESKMKGLEKWVNRLSSQNAQLLREVEKLTKPSEDGQPEPTTEEVANQAKREAREEASLARAVKEFGRETVDAQIFNEDSAYRTIVDENPWVRDRVLSSPDPIYEALEVVKEFEFFDTYGRTPESIKTKLKEEIKAELVKELAKAPTKTVGTKPPSLSDAPTSSSAPNTNGSGFSLDEINPSLAAIR